MSLSTDRKIARVSSDNLKKIAAEGVERALEARKLAGIEMSSEQLNQIAGGFSAIVSPDGAVFIPRRIMGGQIVLAGGTFYPPGTAVLI